MNFQTAQERVEAYLLDLPVATQALIPTWINQAVRDAEEEHNFRHMESTLSATTVAGTRLLVAKPAEWKAVRMDPFLTSYTGNVSEIDWAASDSDMRRQYSNSVTLDIGQPQFVLETPTELHVYPLPDELSDYPDDDYRVTIPYWAYSADMALTTDTTEIMTLSPMYVIYRACALGFIFNRDEDRAANYFALAQERFTKLKNADKRSRIPSRFSLSPRRDVYGPGMRPRLTNGWRR